jgi:hypothetical protein
MSANLFYSYAREDEALRRELEKHLSILHRQGLISSWHDRQVAAGQDWAKDIDAHLNSATLILLLISADFLASNYCYSVEMQRALQRHEAKEARVIPVLLRSVHRQGAPFEKLQVLPSNGIPIAEWPDRDAAFADIARGIGIALQLPEVEPPPPSPVQTSAAPTSPLPPLEPEQVHSPKGCKGILLKRRSVIIAGLLSAGLAAAGVIWWVKSPSPTTPQLPPCVPFKVSIASSGLITSGVLSWGADVGRGKEIGIIGCS